MIYLRKDFFYCFELIFDEEREEIKESQLT
jgi:hypothetical protein